MSDKTAKSGEAKETNSRFEDFSRKHPDLNLLGQLKDQPQTKVAENQNLSELAASEDPVPRSPKKWHADHDALVQKSRTTNVPLVFYGDSITAGMTEGDALKVAFKGKAENFGIVGDSTQHLLWRLKNGEASFKTEPKQAVLLIGANNITHASQDDIVKGIMANIKELNTRLPDTKVLVLGVLPQGKTLSDPRRNEIEEINAELAKQLNGKANVKFFDVGPLMLEKDGSMSSKIWWGDGLHPRDYTPMFDAIKPVLAAMDRATAPSAPAPLEHLRPSPWLR